MDNFTAVQIVEGVQYATGDDCLVAWQHLIDTGLAWRLQGWFGRMASELISNGLCTNLKAR